VPSDIARADPRLAELPSTAIAVAVGIAVAQPQWPSTYGRVSALIDELRRRGEWDAVTAVLDPQLVRSIDALESADRGQRWARTGRR